MPKPKPGNDTFNDLYNQLMDQVVEIMRTAGRLKDLQEEIYPPPWAAAKHTKKTAQ